MVHIQYCYDARQAFWKCRISSPHLFPNSSWIWIIKLTRFLGSNTQERLNSPEQGDPYPYTSFSPESVWIQILLAGLMVSDLTLKTCGMQTRGRKGKGRLAHNHHCQTEDQCPLFVLNREIGFKRQDYYHTMPWDNQGRKKKKKKSGTFQDD